MKNSNLKALFLHGGPGLHSAVERVWFGDSLPVLWWDQPAIATGDPAPFRTLVERAAGQLQAMANSGGGKVDLVAHSFGCMIAAVLAKEHPVLIGRITLLACVSPDPFRPFLHLGQKLLDAGYERPTLPDALKAARENPDENRFAALIGACFPDLSLPGIYFAPGSAAARDRYHKLASATPPIDVPTFFAGMFDLLRTRPLSRADEFDGEVVTLLGRHDPLLRPEESKEAVAGIFPQARFEVVDAGHFPHLELPPGIWFGPA